MLTLFERVRTWWKSRRTQQITPEQVRERVQRGAEYLDSVDPEWYRRVDSETLELEDGRHCVLGQLHGEFRLGLGRSHLISMSSAPRTSLSPVAYGFKCVMNVPDEWQAYDYDLLNEAWKEAVRTRQENDPVLSDDDLIASSGDSVPEAPAEPIPAEA
ncbi:MAG TPA: hypothetical protein VJ884_01975 [Salinibacter sp.]|nr:hypothetical protein [Salinibacter sp.]